MNKSTKGNPANNPKLKNEFEDSEFEEGEEVIDSEDRFREQNEQKAV